MSSPADFLFQSASLRATLFPPSSRYHGIETVIDERDPEQGLIYLRRRFLPDPATLPEVGQHLVCQAERLDHIAAARIGDPTAFWQICDANRAMRPAELTETLGRRLRITLPVPPGGPLV